MKKWLGSSKNHGIVQKALFFFDLTPGIDFMNNFDIEECFSHIGCVFLSDVPIAKNAMYRGMKKPVSTEV